MSIPKHYYLMIDTEFCHDKEESYVYDLGMVVTDRKGKIYAKYSFIIYEVLYGMHHLMKTAYYLKKLQRYYEDINIGKRKVVTFALAKKITHALIEKYNITAIIAYNARCDYSALNNTATLLEKKKSYFFPYNIPIWCTFTMATQLYKNRPCYIDFCKENNYLCKNGTPKLTAEILYRFISRDNSFIESHTGLEDVMIEKEILMHIIRQHKKIRRTYYIEKV